jgi:hypothetical protein
LKVTLKFQTAKELWAFKVNTQSDCVQVNTKDLILDCDCSDENIALAISEYNAAVKEGILTA